MCKTDLYTIAAVPSCRNVWTSVALLIVRETTLIVCGICQIKSVGCVGCVCVALVKLGCAAHEAAPNVDLLLTHDESALRHYGLVRDLSIPAQMFLLCFLVPIRGIAIIQFP
jgi:hypothetical protein